MSYIGRFAPSPTGELHFGSLVAAVGSYLQAKTRGGKWLVRIEDIDPPREVPGSACAILRELERLGMRPDPPLLYQSSRLDAYRLAWEQLIRSGQAYYCRCSRSMLPDTGIYPGTCRDGKGRQSGTKRIRFRVDGATVRFEDQIMGPQKQDLADTIGDFVIRRPDGWPAYQLAVVVDDAHQKISEVVRGGDLLDSTPRQIALQRALGLPQPQYCHLPVAVAQDGSKLSKRMHSDPVNALPAAAAVREALVFLGQPKLPPMDLEQTWTWALRHWDRARVPRKATLPAGSVS